MPGGAQSPSGQDVASDHLAPCERDEAKVNAMLEEYSAPYGLVARSVGKSEVKTNPAAEEAVLLEWKKLRDRECWD